MVGFFFFQAEDGIRDVAVTGVQTCALPIFQPGAGHTRLGSPAPGWMATSVGVPDRLEAEAPEAVSCAGGSANPTGPRPGDSLPGLRLEPVPRSGEHTPELPSPLHPLCRLLLAKK